MVTAPTVSVVIPTYNRCAALVGALRPLLDAHDALEIIVVVDGSQDGSAALLSRQARDHARVRPLIIDNVGDTGARQAGLERARGEVVLFLDDDVVAHAGLVAKHARHHARRGPGVVVVGYMPVAGSIQPAQRVYASDYEILCQRYRDDADQILLSLWAGNVSMRRSDALRVGMANPSYTERYHADRDFGLRCLRAGLQGVFDDELKATHHYSRDFEAVLRDAESSGAGTMQLRARYGDLIGAETTPIGVDGAPRAVAALMRAAARPRNRAAVLAAARVADAVAGFLGRSRDRDGVVRLLRRIGQQAGRGDP